MKLIAILLALLPVQAFAFDHKPATEAVRVRLEQGDTRSLATEAFANMFLVAETLLERRGHPEEARALKIDWEGHYAFVVAGLLDDAGDHAPLSQWVQEWYQKLEDLLGIQTMELTHLRDIWVLNFTIPVTFSPHEGQAWCSQQLAAHPADTCKAEYRRHFAGTKYAAQDDFATSALHHGFAGVVTYWVVWGICEAVTYGGGWFVVCAPAGDLAEIAIEMWVAPRASDAIWSRENP